MAAQAGRNSNDNMWFKSIWCSPTVSQPPTLLGAHPTVQMVWNVGIKSTISVIVQGTGAQMVGVAFYVVNILLHHVYVTLLSKFGDRCGKRQAASSRWTVIFPVKLQDTVRRRDALMTSGGQISYLTIRPYRNIISYFPAYLSIREAEAVYVSSGVTVGMIWNSNTIRTSRDEWIVNREYNVPSKYFKPLGIIRKLEEMAYIVFRPPIKHE